MKFGQDNRSCPTCEGPVNRKNFRAEMQKCRCGVFTCRHCRNGKLCRDCFLKTSVDAELYLVGGPHATA